MTRGAERSEIRRLMSARRASLEAAIQADASRVVTRIVASASWFAEARCIALYVASGGEVDPAGIANEARSGGTVTAYPIVEGSALAFYAWDGSAPMAAGEFGIPIPPATHPVRVDELDLVIVPLVAFGPNGARLGRGGGHYDRTFSDLAKAPGPSRPMLVGLAHPFQWVEELGLEEWDVALDAVVITDGRTTWRDSGRR